MSKFGNKELVAYLWVSGIMAVIGLILVAVMKSIPNPETGYWSSYVTVTYGAGWVAMVTGLASFMLAMAHMTTDFFSVDSRINDDEFFISLGVTGVVCIILIVMAMKGLSNEAIFKTLTPEQQGSPDELVKKAQTFRTFVSLMILIVGGSIAAFPCIRWFKR